MKIVAISASQIPSSAANSLQAMKAVHALAQIGHEVTLIVPLGEQAHPGWDDLAVFYGLQTEFQLEYLPSASRRLFFLSAVRRAKSLKPDLLYVWPLQSAVLGLMHGLPVILEMHDLPTGRIGPLWFRYFRDFKGNRRMAVITRALQEALNERFGVMSHSDVILAPNGVEISRFENLPGPAEARKALGLKDALTVVCTGHLYAGRGVDLFIKLAALPEMRAVQFVWAGGRPEDVASWKEKARDVENITFTGFVPNAQLPLYQASADLLLMPYARDIGISSGKGHSAQVSSPMKMFEYLATGRAIVASDLPVFHEVLNESNAVFCQPENVEAWKNTLHSLLFDPGQRRDALAQQAKNDVQKYLWTVRASRILDGFPG